MVDNADNAQMAREKYELLLNILSDPEMLDALCSLPPTVMSQEMYTALSRLYYHFKISTPKGRASRSTQDDVGNSSISVKNLHDNPFRRILKLEQLPSPPDSLRLYISHFGTEPRELFDDGEPLCDESKSFSGGEAVGEFFAARYTYTTLLEARGEIDRVRWLFLMLMFFDLVKYLNPDATGRRVGPEMQRKADLFLQTVFKQNNQALAKAKENINVWNLCGRRINLLCQRFGPGCLFFLVKELSKDFLITKFRETGPVFESAMAHLESLGLEEAATGNDFNLLASNVRDYLQAPFREWFDHKRGDHIDAPVRHPQAGSAEHVGDDEISDDDDHELDPKENSYGNTNRVAQLGTHQAATRGRFGNAEPTLGKKIIDGKAQTPKTESNISRNSANKSVGGTRRTGKVKKAAVSSRSNNHKDLSKSGGKSVHKARGHGVMADLLGIFRKEWHNLSV